ncbi:unnamed protein product [Mytilus coruscus]|uniref:ZMYM2-like/QRICH1 C-terminal domain-containing protein n=1 Tax=Mytilus coruscus TaxID=42192 RepID=A0A6J8AJ87_MYTCO|nr:unnamed protein product [Mytilus coruscus]
MRTRLKHVELRWGDIELKQREEFLLYTERATKTRTGQSNDSRPFQPKMFADPENPRCPVHAYKVFKDNRLAEMLKSESPFYIGVARSSKDQFDKWFINQAMGKNTIGSIVKKMCEEAGITGHKNVNSINSYSTASEQQQQKEMSSIITNYAGKPATASSTSISNYQNRTTKATVEYSIPNDTDDEVLVSASHEIVEQTLKTIRNFETNEISDINVSATSNMHVQDIGIAPLIKYIPQNVLSGATINGNVVLQFDKLSMSDYENKENSGNKRKRRVRVIESDSDSE